jgi:hypothetical protein
MKSDDGTEYVVYEYQEFLDASTYDGEKWVPGLKWLELNDGSKLNHIDDDTFKIVRSGTIVRRA